MHPSAGCHVGVAGVRGGPLVGRLRSKPSVGTRHGSEGGGGRGGGGRRGRRGARRRTAADGGERVVWRGGVHCRAPASDEGRRLHHPVHGSVHSPHRCGEEHGGSSHAARGSHGPCPRIHARHHGGHHAELDWHLLPRVVGLRAPRLHTQGALPEVEAGWAPMTLPLLPAARKAQQHFPGVLD